MNYQCFTVMILICHNSTCNSSYSMYISTQDLQYDSKQLQYQILRKSFDIAFSVWHNAWSIQSLYNIKIEISCSLSGSKVYSFIKLHNYIRRPPIIVEFGRPIMFFRKIPTRRSSKIVSFFCWWQVLQIFRHGILTQNQLFKVFKIFIVIVELIFMLLTC